MIKCQVFVPERIPGGVRSTPCALERDHEGPCRDRDGEWLVVEMPAEQRDTFMEALREAFIKGQI